MLSLSNIARNENAATKATKTPVKIHYNEYKNENYVLIFPHNLDGDKVLPYIIAEEKLSSFDNNIYIV